MLRNLPLFRSMTDQQFGALQPAMQRRVHHRGSVLLASGDQAEALCVILSGTARVVVHDRDGREFVLSILGVNDLLGELGMIDPRPSVARVEARDRCEVLHIARQRVLECLPTNPVLSLAVTNTLAARLRESQAHVQALALCGVYERVMQLLAHVIHKAPGVRVIDLNSQEIASRVGASREMVSRVIKQMIERGLLLRQRRLLIVPEPALLSSESAREWPRITVVKQFTRSSAARSQTKQDTL